MYSSLVTVPAGETRSIRFELHGSIATGGCAPPDLLSQPTINADGAQVHTDDPAARIIGADGLVVVGDRASIDAQVTSNRRFSVSFAAR